MLTTESNQKKYPVPFSRMQLVMRKVCKGIMQWGQLYFKFAVFTTMNVQNDKIHSRVALKLRASQMRTSQSKLQLQSEIEKTENVTAYTVQELHI